MILKNYGTVLTTQSSLEAMSQTIRSVATLPELSPSAIYEPAWTCPPRENSISRKRGEATRAIY